MNPWRRQLGLCLPPFGAALATVLGLTTTLSAQPAYVPAVPLPASPQPVDLSLPAANLNPFSLDQAPEQARSLLTEVALATIPSEYEDERKWGQTKKVWDGLHVHMDGLEVKTKRRWKEVKHGTWKKYRVSLIDPDQHLKASISHLRQIGPGRIAFQLSLAAKVDAYARLQEWRRGLRLMSISADAVADIELDVAFEMTTELDASQFPPDLVLKPVATAADLRLVQFKLKRVSKADGPIIRELGDGLEDVLRKRLADKRDKLTEKINKAIAKNSDELRLSLHDLVKQRWSGAESQVEGEPGLIKTP